MTQKTAEMRYQFAETPLRLRAFGRNIQSMIEYAITIPNRYERTEVAYQIAKTLLHLHPNVKENADFQQYIWDSIFIMSDLKLEVDAPFPKPTAEQLLVEKPKRLPYQQGKPRFSQYGRNVEYLIDRACDAPTEAIFMDYVYKIVHFMHLCLLDMNKESYIEPIIAEHIYEISGGRLRLEIAEIQAVTRPFSMEAEPPVKRQQGGGGGRNRNQNPRNENPQRRENPPRADNNNPNFKRRPPNNKQSGMNNGGGGMNNGGMNNNGGGGMNNGGGRNNNNGGGGRNNNGGMNNGGMNNSGGGRNNGGMNNGGGRNNNGGGMNDNPKRRR
jgi:hypothetical protein